MLAPLLLGGVPTWAPAVLAPFAIAALISASIGRSGVRLPLFGGVLGLLLLICAAQLVPLPPPLLAFFSPPADTLREFALVPVGLTQWRPISLDAPATWRELLKAALVLAVFIAATLVSKGSRRVRPVILGAIAATGAALVASAFIHQLLGIDALFGIFRFSFTPRVWAPFGNPNHLAGFLILSGTLCGALSVESKTRRTRIAWLAGWALCGVGVLLSLSRAGIGVFCLAQLALVAGIWWAGRNTRVSSSEAPPAELPPVGLALRLGLAGAVVLAGAAALFFERLSDRFGDRASYALKLDVWPHALAAAREHWRTGMGRGAFEVVFTRFPWEHVGKTFTHPESWPLQLMCELGIPLAVLVTLAAAFTFVDAARKSRKTPLELAVLIAVGAVVLQNVFDFNLEYPGVAVPLAAAFGVLLGSLDEVRTFKLPLWPTAVAVSLVLLLGAWRGRDNLRERETALVAQSDAAKSSTEVRKAALLLIDDHPHDFLPWTLAAAASAQKPPRDAREALAFANRALLLSPNDFNAHLVSAVALASLGHRSQALLEYRLAFVSAYDTNAPIDGCTRYAQGVDELMQCVPARGYAAKALVARAPTQQDAIGLVRRYLDELPEPDRTEVAPDLAEAGVRALLGLQREPEAQALLEEIAHRTGPSPKLALAAAEAAAQAGKDDDALSRLQAAATQWPQDFDLAVALARGLMKAHRFEAARASVLKANSATTDAGRRAELKSLESQCDDQLGRREAAVEGFRAAARLAPRPHYHYAAATVLMQLSRYDDAWAEVRAGQRADSPEGAVAADQRFKDVEISHKSTVDGGR